MEHSATILVIPAWLIITLPGDSVGEFSFQHKSKYEISICGIFVNDEWVISLRVYALPYMAYGCNNYHTGMKDRFQVIRYFLMDFVNKISEYTTEGLKEITILMRNTLE